MALAADPLADVEAGDAGAQLRDLAHILMADDLGRLDVLLRPLVPLVDVDVGAADCRLVNFDEHLTGAGPRNRHPPQLQSLRRSRLDDGIHPLLFHR